MRIAMISTPFVSVPPKDYGGTELVVSELVEGLVARGHEVALFAPADSETNADLRSLYPAAVWPPNPLPDQNHISWALREAVHDGFELAHAHSAGALAFGRLCPQLPLVYTVHHDRSEELSDYYAYFPECHFVAISRDQAEREVGVPKKRVIHHGLDPAKYAWAERPGDYVFFIGRFAPYKGPHTAIDAADRAGVRIRMAGGAHDEHRAFADREVAPRLKRGHVTFHGPVGHREKMPLLRNARALLAPITWNEPFGLVLIEAMLSGCPVIAYPRGSVPELVEDGLTGFVVEGEDEIVELIRPGGAVDGFDRAQCRERAVERFSAERMVADHEALYRRVLAERAAQMAGAAA